MTLFNIISIMFPEETNIEKIYNSIYMSQLDGFSNDIKELSIKITSATIKIYNAIVERLPRTPLKFHYIFNLRDLSRIYQGLGKANKQFFDKPQSFIRLWKHEITRVFCDRLSVEEDGVVVKDELMKPIILEVFGKETAEDLAKGSYLFCDFMESEPLEVEHHDPKLYQEVPKLELVNEKLEDLLEQYNNENTGKEMNLVLFEDAISHIIRLTRILGFPGGHALLVGYGGSGKQSITKLATFIAGFELFEINLKRNYKEANFKEDLEVLFIEMLPNNKKEENRGN